MVETPRRMEAGQLVAQRFVVEARVASGGMGTVYRAHDRVGGASVAVKLVLDAGTTGARFAQEARVLGELEHPAIVRYVAHGEDDAGRAYLVMEWLDGEDLGERLARGPLSVEETVTLGRRIAEALAFAHARGVVHRDVKPGNLFLVGRDVARAKVLDFGIARTRGGGAYDATIVPITRTGAVLGTVGYMSPEQARGAAQVDERTDVFALGCVLYECLVGRPAFAGPTPVAVLAKVLLEEAPRVRTHRRDVPSELDELVARMLAKDPAERPHDVAAALATLATSQASGGPTTGSLGGREQRLVSVVLARGPRAKDARAVIEEADVLELADGAIVFALRGADPASHAASAALALARTSADGRLAIATGRMLTGVEASIGPVIDSAAEVLPEQSGIRVDALSAALLGDRYEIEDGWLRGVARRASGPRLLLGRRTPCVGRDKELALLEATFRESADDSVARAVLVTALAGAGKSRLAQELVARIGDDAGVLFARADPVGAGAPLGLVRLLVESAAGMRASDPEATRHAALRASLARSFSADELDRQAELLGELVGAPAAHPSAALRAVRDDARLLAGFVRRAFETWAEAISDLGPVVFVLEDVHWGDRASLALVEDALRRCAASPLFVLALARPELHEVAGDLWGKVGVQVMRLPGLTRRAAERLVREVLPEASEETAAQIVGRAEGNAFCLEELIRHVADGRAGALPETVLALAESRVARLDPEQRRALRAASILGDVFWDGAVAAILDEPREGVASTLRVLVEQELLGRHVASRFAGERELAFRHGLLRDVAYALVPDEDRVEAHGRAGAWLEGAGENEPLVLAAHFEAARDAGRAAPHLLAAARRAVESLDLVVLERLEERAARLEVSDDVRAELASTMALCSMGVGERERALARAKEAYALARPGSPARYGAAGVIVQTAPYLGDFEPLPAIVADLLENDPDRASGPYGLGLQCAFDILDSIGQRESAERLREKGRALAERPDADLLFVGWFSYGCAAMSLRRDDIPDALAQAARAGAAFSAAGDGLGLALVEFGSAHLLTELGREEEARVHLASAMARLGRVEDAVFTDWLRVTEGWSWYVEGQPARTLEVVERVFSGLDHRHARALAAFASHALGDLAAAEAHLTHALDRLDEFLVTPWVVSVVHMAHARVLLSRGRARDATEALDRAETAGLGLLPGYTRTLLAALQIEALRALGDDASASAQLARVAARIRAREAALPAELAASFVRSGLVASLLRDAEGARLVGQSP